MCFVEKLVTYQDTLRICLQKRLVRKKIYIRNMSEYLSYKICIQDNTFRMRVTVFTMLIRMMTMSSKSEVNSEYIF